MGANLNLNQKKIDRSELSYAQKFLLPEFEEEKKLFFLNLAKKIGNKRQFEKFLSEIKYYWPYNGRPKQFAPKGDWFVWLIRSGRGFGKSRAASEWIREKEQAARQKRSKVEIGLVGNIFEDIKDSQVKSIIECYSPTDPNRPEYKDRKLQWPGGSLAYLIQAETPEKFRSKNLTYLWIDELAKYQYPQKVWDAARLVTRIGKRPQICISTTPAQTANKLLREIEQHKYGKCVVVTGASYENLDLSEAYKNEILQSYEGTRLGAQELYGNFIETLSGALWQEGMVKYLNNFVEEYGEP